MAIKYKFFVLVLLCIMGGLGCGVKEKDLQDIANKEIAERRLDLKLDEKIKLESGIAFVYVSKKNNDIYHYVFVSFDGEVLAYDKPPKKLAIEEMKLFYD